MTAEDPDYRDVAVGAYQGYEAEALPTPPITIEGLDLSVRGYNVLKRNDVTTVEQLTRCTEDQLLDMRNMGQKPVQEIKEALARHGLHLAGPHPWTDEVVHEMVNIYRCGNVELTISPDGTTHLNMAHYSPAEFGALRKIIADLPEGEE
jgi:hypothetical protein